MKVRHYTWRKAGPPLPPTPVLAEDFSVLIRKRRTRQRRDQAPDVLH